MGNRMKIFVVIAILGFVAGVVAQVFVANVIPWMQQNMPDIGNVVPYLIAGVVGACLTVALVSVWAYMTSKREAY